MALFLRVLWVDIGQRFLDRTQSVPIGLTTDVTGEWVVPGKWEQGE